MPDGGLRTEQSGAAKGSLRAARYRVTFTPVGWQVIDTVEARDPVAEFGTGTDEYERAKTEAERLNKEESDG